MPKLHLIVETLAVYAATLDPDTRCRPPECASCPMDGLAHRLLNEPETIGFGIDELYIYSDHDNGKPLGEQVKRYCGGGFVEETLVLDDLTGDLIDAIDRPESGRFDWNAVTAGFVADFFEKRGVYDAAR